MAHHFYHPSFKLGILGGGQLGRMFIQEAINLNVNVGILDPDINAPCKHLVEEFTCGSLQDFDTVMNFGKDKSVLTIEIEHVNVDALEALEKSGKKVFPQPRVLRIVQDKGLQKEFYTQHQIPTAPYFLVENKSEISTYADEFPFFQKMRKGGYDGKGVTKLDNPADLSKAFDVPSVLEKLVPFKKEISVIVSRNEDGEMSHFPVVDCEFNPEANLVEFLFAPADIDEAVEKNAIAIARKVIEALDMVGILAVEMFLMDDGSILVNEIAPRPHNSGHHTIEGNITSQYEQHLRSILNLPPGSTDTLRPAVMVNILGEPGFEGDAIYEGLEKILDMPGVFVHLYGKKTTKPFRKMGHVTIIASNIKRAREMAFIVKETLKVKA